MHGNRASYLLAVRIEGDPSETVDSGQAARRLPLGLTTSLASTETYQLTTSFLLELLAPAALPGATRSRAPSPSRQRDPIRLLLTQAAGKASGICLFLLAASRPQGPSLGGLLRYSTSTHCPLPALESTASHTFCVSRASRNVGPAGVSPERLARKSAT